MLRDWTNRKRPAGARGNVRRDARRDEGRGRSPAAKGDPVRPRRRACRLGERRPEERARRRFHDQGGRRGARSRRAGRGRTSHRASTGRLALQGVARERHAGRPHLRPDGRADHGRNDRALAAARGRSPSCPRLFPRGRDDGEAARDHRARAGFRAAPQLRASAAGADRLGGRERPDGVLAVRASFLRARRGAGDRGGRAVRIT